MSIRASRGWTTVSINDKAEWNYCVEYWKIKTQLRARPVVNEGVNIRYRNGSPREGNVWRRGRTETNE